MGDDVIMGNLFSKDIIVVTVGNALYLLAQIAIGLLLPMVMSVDDFGYYKVYTLYFTYGGLLHFGFVDGLLLKLGGRRYSDLDKPAIGRYLSIYTILEMVSAFAVVLISMVFLQGIMRTVIMMVSISMILSNMILFYQYLSQATSRFKEFALLKGLNALLILLCVGVMLILKYHKAVETDFVTLIILLISISFLILILYIFIYRDVTFGKKTALPEVWGGFLDMMKSGIVMTLAYEVSRLVLLIDRQFVSILFDIDVYAKYAFAYNILSCFTALIVGVSTVLFPKFKQLPIDRVMKTFSDSLGGIIFLVALSLLTYYPICMIIEHFLPQYTDSIVYLQIIFPVLALSASITIMIFTYYKVLNKNSVFLSVCLITLVVAFALNVVAYRIFGTPEAISVASVIATIIWYLLSIRYFVKEYKVRWIKNFIYALCTMSSFYITAFLIDGLLYQALVYLSSIIAFSCLFVSSKKLDSNEL